MADGFWNEGRFVKKEVPDYFRPFVDVCNEVSANSKIL